MSDVNPVPANAPIGGRDRRTLVRVGRSSDGLFSGRPVLKLAMSILTPWLAASILLSLVVSIAPREEIPFLLPEDIGILDRVRLCLECIPLAGILIIPAVIVLGIPAALLLRLMSWPLGGATGGRPSAVASVVMGMSVGALALIIYLAVFMLNDQERLYYCMRHGVQPADPRCFMGPWDYASAILPGGGAGYVYWLMAYWRTWRPNAAATDHGDAGGQA